MHGQGWALLNTLSHSSLFNPPSYSHVTSGENGDLRGAAVCTQGQSWDWNPALCPTPPSASSWSDSAVVRCMPAVGSRSEPPGVCSGLGVANRHRWCWCGGLEEERGGGGALFTWGHQVRFSQEVTWRRKPEEWECVKWLGGDRQSRISGREWVMWRKVDSVVSKKNISWGRSQRTLSVMLRSVETPPPSAHKLAWSCSILRNQMANRVNNQSS